MEIAAPPFVPTATESHGRQIGYVRCMRFLECMRDFSCYC